MFVKQEARREAKGLSDLIDYFALVSDGVVVTSTGLYVAGWEAAGPDMEALEPRDAYQIANRLARKLQFGSGWTIQCDLIRSENQEYSPEASWPDPVSYLIDFERRGRFTATGQAATRLSRYFISISYEPAGKKSARGFARSLYESPHTETRVPALRALAEFEKRLQEIENLLRASLPVVRRLKGSTDGQGQPFDELLSYLRQCVSGRAFPFAVPDVPVFLNQYMATDDFTGGEEPCLGHPENDTLPGKHIRVLAIDSFPAHTFAGILRDLDQLPFEFRFCMQAQLMDEQEAKKEHEANRGSWSFRKASAAKQLTKTGVAGVRVNKVAALMEEEANDAAAAAEFGTEIFVKFSAKVILMFTDREDIRSAVAALVRTINRAGFSLRIETHNVVAAWLASFPGQHYRDIRQFTINTANLVHMMPLSAPFRGHEFNPSKFFPAKTPPLFYAMTSGGTPYRFHPFVEDVGHQLIVGPTGGGKTTWLALGIAQWFRYANGQVFAFDKKRTLYTLCKAMGGDFYDMNPDSRDCRLCPLQDLATNGDLQWAAQWIELLLKQNDLDITPAVRNSVKDGIDLLARNPGGRSLTDFQMAVGSREVQDALEFYIGSILDGDRDNIRLSRFSVFEMDELYWMDPKLMNGALFYIFGRIRKRLNSGIPTLVTVDEFREALSHELAAKYFNDFLFEGRKLNMAVWLIVQEMSRVLDSPLRGAVLEQCHTKVLLPNFQATADGAGSYALMGLNNRDRELIANATPKSDYYVATADGNKRMISLELQQVTLAFLAASGEADRALVDQLSAEHGNHWPGEWLRRRGLIEWADKFDEVAGARQTTVATR